MASFRLSAFADEAGTTLAEQIDALVANGITRIEPRSIDGRGILELSEEELLAVREALDRAGIRTGSVGSPIGKYPIDEPFEPHLQAFDRALAAARILGTDKIRMFSFFVTQDALAEKREEVMRRLTVMCERAEAVGVRLCHENESAIYGQMPREVGDIFASVPALGGILDPANYIVNGADVKEGMRYTLPHLTYMHIKDAIYNDEGKHIIVPAGEGDGDIAGLLSAVDAHTDAEIMLTVEPHLHIFDAYAKIDGHGLTNKHVFASRREAFDAAIRALTGILQNLGYHEEDGVWKK